MSVERILITVKTYPTLSRTYGETVCTAGLREDGSWVRIYPVPFRRIEDLQQYHKYEWIECDLIGNAQKDKRPESRRPADLQTLKRVGHIGTDDRWRERRSLVLEKGEVFTVLQRKQPRGPACTICPIEQKNYISLRETRFFLNS